MATQEIKATFGYLLLLAAVIAFIVAFLAASYYLAVLFILGGLLAWMIYLNIANVGLHRPIGAILIVFGVLLATAIFMAFGIEQDVWGGYRLKPEGATLSLIILFFAIMPGLVFYYFHKPGPPRSFPPKPPVPSPEEPTGAPFPSPESAGAGEGYEYPEWADYEHYDPEAFAAYYEAEGYEEEDEEQEEED